jgi:hypothetical protein
MSLALALTGCIPFYPGDSAYAQHLVNHLGQPVLVSAHRIASAVDWYRVAPNEEIQFGNIGSEAYRLVIYDVRCVRLREVQLPAVGFTGVITIEPDTSVTLAEGDTPTIPRPTPISDGCAPAPTPTPGPTQPRPPSPSPRITPLPAYPT